MKPAALGLTLVLMSLSLRAESFTVRVQEKTTVEIPGTTAAYAIDPSIADVAASGMGRVEITGRSAGTTQIIVVTASGTRSFLITVAPAVSVQVPRAVALREPIARVESHYSSDSAQLANSFDVFTTDGERQSQLHLVNVHYFRDTFGRSADAFPFVFYRLRSPERTITFLDELVDISPVTIHSTQIRGVHYTSRSLELHAGYAATSMYEDVFLPASRRWVASAAYAFGRGDVRVIPSVYQFFSEPAGSLARKGTIGSLAVEKRSGDTFFARGEVASGSVSRSVGGSAEVRYDGESDVLRSRASYKPQDFPTLALSDVPGTHGELDWTHRATKRLQFDTYGAYDQLTRPLLPYTIGIANVEARYAITRTFSMLTGIDSTYVNQSTTSFRTIAVPVGLMFDTEPFGAAASYRILDSSNTSRRGDVLRLSARASTPRFHVNAWAERQRQAPTLDLIFRDAPGLQLALLRLGISVRSPEDLARVLRDNAALINLGYIEGLTVNFTPLRRQAGIDIAFNTIDLRNQLRLHAVTDRTEGIGATRDTTIATLTYTRRLATGTDLYGSYSRWRSGLLSREIDGSAYDVGIRQRFDGLPDFLKRGGTIQGVVYLDPNMRGARLEETSPVPGIAVTLDGNRTATTDRSGHYEFAHVPRGTHRVALQLSAERPAFFTSPSRAEVEPPAHVDFGFVWSPARIIGRVVSDAKMGVSGVVVTATAPNGTQVTATTDTEGAFQMATPEGPYDVELAVDTFPAGYLTNDETKHQVKAIAGEPVKVAFGVSALRGIMGVARGVTEVRIEPLGRTAPVDAAGNFAFRSLPSGTFTLRAKRLSATVTLPAEPSTQTVTLTEGPAETAVVGTAPGRGAGPSPEGALRFRVQTGVYRIKENATVAQRQLERAGFRAIVETSGGLQIVSAGTFASRYEAEALAKKLSKAGIDAVVVPDGSEVMHVRTRDFYVQLGAFRELANAKDLAGRIRTIGHEQPQVVNAGRLILVRVGPFASRTAALETSDHLRHDGFDNLVTAP